MLELPLDKDLQQKKETLKEFYSITLRVLQYLPNVLSKVEEKVIIKFSVLIILAPQNISDL
jgi:hypothetical protein